MTDPMIENLAQVVGQQMENELMQIVPPDVCIGLIYAILTALLEPDDEMARKGAAYFDGLIGAVSPMAAADGFKDMIQNLIDRAKT